jgi:hypothetical protein
MIEIASCGHAAAHAVHALQWLSMTIKSGKKSCDSGLEHHRHFKGQPFIKTVVRIPGPSCTLNRCILKTRPFFLRLFDDKYMQKSFAAQKDLQHPENR